MTPEDFETKLTAYALNDASLTDAERGEIETRLRTDPAARQLLEETRQLGHLLTKSLAAEVQAAEPSVAPAVASSLARKSKLKRWAITITSLAAVVMLAVFAGQSYFDSSPQREPTRDFYALRVSGDQPPGDSKPVPTTMEAIDGLSVAAIRAKAKSPQELAESPQQPGSKPADPYNPVPGGAVATGGASLGGLGYGPGGFGSVNNGGFGGGGGIPGGGFGGGLGGPGGRFGEGGMGTEPGRPRSRISERGLGSGSSAAPIPGIPAAGTPAGEVKGEPADASTALAGFGAGSDLGVAGDSSPRVGGKPQPSDLAKRSYAGGRDQYRQLIENPFTRVEGQDALSTFGVDVDTASYAIVRNMLNHNTLPHPDAVRLEEMINYFPYRDAPPEGDDPFTVRVEMAGCPWASKHRLARVSLKAKPIDNGKRPASNLVFLIDVSGSMNEPNKLPLVKAAMKLLVEQLTENDRVALVVYAGASGIVLDSTNASKKDAILNAIDSLSAGGSTNGGSGIQLAYETAVKNFIEKGTNRVILCTDGDWNVGTTGTAELVKLIEEKKQTGVFLSVFGFGMGNLRDEMMVQLAGKGNGNYGYIDTIAEAKKALVEQISGTLVTVAKDVKIQIEFNPAKVAAYRLIGYEKRKLAAEDFHNDKKDAGEMGAGHVVTALYELVPAGEALNTEPKVDGLRYQPAPAAEKPKANADEKTSKEAFVVKLRHKMPDAEKSTLREIPVGDVAKSYDTASEDFRFGSAVAAFGMLLKQSPYKGQANYALVEELAASSMAHDPGAYRAEFLQLVKKAKALSKQP
ncbi:YfbK domain-containing protein [Limnoglobus roseus]|uniref:VWFA domain-containing protein n=1 Tax=Limnoglobus roseus TaxID=2598579 RepID=A0A5C1AG36_9BACT|nr:von Willebrand factor type A domain-containing protein [Limnoglobus roseus]QEL17097.1 hypothetical protein PX52LOC_04074 [Limnoglobus roseus]